MSKNQTKIFIRDLKVQALLGIYPQEIGKKQGIVVNVEAILTDPVIASDNIECTVSYTPIREEILRLANIQFSLAEKLADQIVDFCFKEPRLCEVKVRVEKINIFSDCVVGSEIIRTR